LDYIVHQDRKQFRYSMDARSKSTILSRTVYRLSRSLCLFGPLPSYRVYDVEYAKFVGSWGLFEMGVQLLDEY